MKALATFGVGYHQVLHFMSKPRMELYADRHGYEFVCGTGESEGRPSAWGKVLLIKSLLSDYEEVLWIDADVVIVDLDKDILDDVRPSHYQGLSFHEGATGSIVPNTGVWVVRRKLLPWLDAIWNSCNYINHEWWEQAALMNLMGFRLDGNYSTPPSTLTELLANTEVLDIAWNYHPSPVNASVYPKPKFYHAVGVDGFKINRMAESLRLCTRQ